MSKATEESESLKKSLSEAEEKHATEKSKLESDLTASQAALEEAKANHASVIERGMATMSQMETTLKAEIAMVEAKRESLTLTLTLSSL